MRTFKQYHNELTRKKKYVAKETIFNTLSLIFVKVNRSKVNVYELAGQLRSDPVVSLYEKHIKLHYWPSRYYGVFSHLSSFAKFSLNSIQFHDFHQIN